MAAAIVANVSKCTCYKSETAANILDANAVAAKTIAANATAANEFASICICRSTCIYGA